MIIIGDVHGKLERYKEIISNSNESICVGDFGFKQQWDELHELNIPQHKINMGNHDYIPYCHTSPNSLGDYAYLPDHNIFTIRGADSIDKYHRIEGRDWFRDEEVNYTTMLSIIQSYAKHKPDIVISHDCPQTICKSIFGIHDNSFTRLLLEHLFKIHRPKQWIFGHHHKSITKNIFDTTFTCLSELEVLNL